MLRVDERGLWGSVSPSTRRAWIEMLKPASHALISSPSPSTRRAWIEIPPMPDEGSENEVALHPEGVDRNVPDGMWDYRVVMSPSTRRAWIEIRKSSARIDRAEESPSTRRAWIEIAGDGFNLGIVYRRPPPGGRG